MKSINSIFLGITKILFGSGLSQLLNFLLVVIVTRFYGDSDLASLVKVIALSSFIILFFEGGCNYLVVSRSEKALKDIFKIRFLFFFVVSLLYFLIFDLINKYLSVTFDTYIFCYFFSLLSSISNFIAYYYQGQGDINRYTFSFFGRNSIHFFMAILMFWFVEPENIVFFWLLIGSIVNILIILISLKHIDKRLFTIKLDKNIYSTFSLSFYYLMSSLLVMVIIRAEAILLGGDDMQLALYFQAKTFALSISLVSSSFSNYYLSNFSVSINRGWRRFRNQVFLTYLIAMPFLFSLFYFSDLIFKLLYGDNNIVELREIFSIIGFGFSLGIITNSLSIILIKAEVSKVNFYLNLFQTVLVVTVGYMLVNLGLGALGLSIAILSAHVSGFLIILLYTEKKHDLLTKKIMDQIKDRPIKD
ncbi:lipopolysaccharide biosynthesis protein [Vibrio harveyi]